MDNKSEFDPRFPDGKKYKHTNALSSVLKKSIKDRLMTPLEKKWITNLQRKLLGDETKILTSKINTNKKFFGRDYDVMFDDDYNRIGIGYYTPDSKLIYYKIPLDLTEELATNPPDPEILRGGKSRRKRGKSKRRKSYTTKKSTRK
jgi:hypothetical protein